MSTLTIRTQLAYYGVKAGYYHVENAVKETAVPWVVIYFNLAIAYINCAYRSTVLGINTAWNSVKAVTKSTLKRASKSITVAR